MEDFSNDRNISFDERLRISSMKSSIQYYLDKSYIYGQEKHHVHKYNEQL